MIMFLGDSFLNIDNKLRSISECVEEIIFEKLGVLHFLQIILVVVLLSARQSTSTETSHENEDNRHYCLDD